jgi:hypothetical protein
MGSISSNSHRLAIKIFEPVFEKNLFIPVSRDKLEEPLDEGTIREEVYGFLFENYEVELESADYEVYITPVTEDTVDFTRTDLSTTDVWITVNKTQYSSQQLTSTIAQTRKESEQTIKNLDRKLKSYDAAKLAELQSQAVEAEEREIELHKEIIALRASHARERREWEEKAFLQDTKLKSFEVTLHENTKHHEIALTAVLEEKAKLKALLEVNK